MKKLFWIILVVVAMACGDSSTRSEDREAGTEEETDIGSGEEISPQLELDSTDERFEVDSISSSQDAEKESDGSF